jgi:O-antigen ligase
MLCMITALFFSRAALSISIGLFVLLSFLHNNIKSHLRNFIQSPLLLGITGLFLIPLLSGLWSADKETWWMISQIKLPLLFLPLAFAAPNLITQMQWRWLGYFFIVMVFGGTIWSMSGYLNAVSETHLEYLQSKTIQTPLENDHVRFSWIVAVAVLLAVRLFEMGRNKNKLIAWITTIIGIWFIIYLHILAARTGLFSFYIILIAAIIWFGWRNTKRKYSIFLIAGLILLPLSAYFALPTFENRVKYIRYEFDFFKHADYRPGFNDGVRVISINAGLGLIKQQPITGVGFGDVLDESDLWYNEKYPQMIPADRIYPSSEVLLYGAGAGIAGLLVYAFAMLVPFFTKAGNRFYWRALNIIAAFSLLFDIGLEVQFGVFSYCFVILWWYRWGKTEKM